MPWGTLCAMTETGKQHTLDVLGELCPRPVILTQEAFRDLAPGDTLLILADDPGVEADFPLWCKANKQTLVSMDKDPENPRLYRIVLKKEG